MHLFEKEIDNLQYIRKLAFWSKARYTKAIHIIFNSGQKETVYTNFCPSIFSLLVLLMDMKSSPSQLCTIASTQVTFFMFFPFDDYYYRSCLHIFR